VAAVDPRVTTFIELLTRDPVHGKQVKVNSVLRTPEQDATAVLNNVRNDPKYPTKVPLARNWQESVAEATKGRDLHSSVDFQAAVQGLAQWIRTLPAGSPHSSGRAADFAWRDDNFGSWLRTECDEHGFQFKPEPDQHHYHIQLKAD
jgi:hypothetical protein